ncbi:MAG TPA: class I SAM-dependent methyltransferase [Candidatus Polarisedimenticolaceae bacterium]|nr:class I SAM-dependent methyltransferase [Candidatus Polarisedimenticolaceae bacterium]
MQAGEHELMARVEDRHWWYLGLRDLLGRLLPRALRVERPRVLDAGCGTGANLRFVRELLQPAYLGGFDSSATALELARAKVPGADLYVSDVCAPEIHAEALDLVLSLDVIYIPGAERARAGLERLAERLRPGGLFVFNLPAYRWLYSEHDVAIHTRQRFTAGDVCGLVGELGLGLELITYRLCLLFPLVVLARLPRLGRGRAGTARSDLQREPGARLNGALLAVLRAENAGVERGVRWPWGSSVFAIGRKR